MGERSGWIFPVVFVTLIVGGAVMILNRPPCERSVVYEGTLESVSFVPQWGEDATVLTFEDGTVYRFGEELSGLRIGARYRMMSGCGWAISLEEI
jgi:hypothetical protein